MPIRHEIGLTVAKAVNTAFFNAGYLDLPIGDVDNLALWLMGA